MRTFADDLLNTDGWPDSTTASIHFTTIKAAADLALSLEDRLNTGEDGLDAHLHQTFRNLREIVAWMPAPSRASTPAYTRNPWDLRALVALIPKSLALKLEADNEPDAEGDVRYSAALFDYENGRQAQHPSDLQHNSVLFYSSGDYGSAWCPNIAVARILLAAFILAAIQTIECPSTTPALAGPQMNSRRGASNARRAQIA